GEGESNLHSEGSASNSEVDTVINGGADNDTIVLSTNAGSGTPDDFTVSSNNALLNGASNETIKVNGVFGDDTVMNFTTADTRAVVTYDLRDTVVVTNPGTAPTTAATSFAIVEGVLAGGADLEVELTEGYNADEIMGEIALAITTDLTSNFTADTSSTGVIELTAKEFGISGENVNFYVEDRLVADGITVLASFTAEQLGENGLGVVNVDVINDGTDFLDFSDYLKSQEDVSSGTSGGPESNNLIATTLEYSETNSFGGATGDGANGFVDANEVAVVRMAAGTDAGETFDALSGSNVAALFNNTVGGDNAYGDLVQSNFTAPDDANVVDGNGKAIFMVENSANLGEYKVFELTWDATTGSGTTDVAATEIGSLDFGDSLTYLDDVNLVGSDDHAALLTFGFA
ncbi:MAG: hypothetical protein ACJAR0_004659, partial [Candidatus Azotimanducaceae bacterium]